MRPSLLLSAQIYESDGENAYCGIDGTQFKVRGPNYLKDKVKIVSKPCIGSPPPPPPTENPTPRRARGKGPRAAPRPLGITRLRGCDMNMLTEKPVHWCSRPESLPAKAKAKGLKDFFFVYNIVVCAAVAPHRVGHLQEEVHLPLPVPYHPRRPGEHQPHCPQNDPDPPERRRRQVEDQAHQAYPHRR